MYGGWIATPQDALVAQYALNIKPAFTLFNSIKDMDYLNHNKDFAGSVQCKIQLKTHTWDACEVMDTGSQYSV